MEIQFLDTLLKIFSHEYISWYQVNHLGTRTFEMIDLNFWFEAGNLNVINGTVIPHQIFPVLFLWNLFWSSSSLCSFFSLISFQLFLSSSNCRVYRYRLDIRSFPNSGRNQGHFSLFKKKKKKGACFLNSLNIS